MQRLAGYPGWFSGGLNLLLLAIFGSGLILLPPMLEMRLEWESPVHLDSGTRVIATICHTGAGFLVLALTGALLAVHVRIGWRRRLNRTSGVALLALLTGLLLSSIGILYAGDRGMSQASSAAHTLGGLLATPVFTWHLLRAARIRKLLNRSPENPRGSGAVPRRARRRGLPPIEHYPL